MPLHRPWFASTCFAAIALTAPRFAVADQPPVQVVASISILGDMIRNVGGRDVTLTVLIGPNTDAHSYEPTPAAAKALARADLVIMNGLGLESWLDRLISASGYWGAVVKASDGVMPRELDEAGEIVPDPHAWQDLAKASST